MVLWRTALFIHSGEQKSEEWMHPLPIYPCMHGEWLRYVKSTSQISLAFSLKVRDDWGSHVNPHNVATT